MHSAVPALRDASARPARLCLQLRGVPMMPRDRDLEGSGLAAIL